MVYVREVIHDSFRLILIYIRASLTMKQLGIIVWSRTLGEAALLSTAPPAWCSTYLGASQKRIMAALFFPSVLLLESNKGCRSPLSSYLVSWFLFCSVLKECRLSFPTQCYTFKIILKGTESSPGFWLCGRWWILILVFYRYFVHSLLAQSTLCFQSFLPYILLLF